MPAAVVFIVSAIGSAVGGAFGAFLIMNATFIATAAIMIGGLAMMSSQRKKAKAQARAQYNASQVDRLVNMPATTAARELVVGKVRKGGTVVFRDSAGPNKSLFFMVIAVAAHEVTEFVSFYLNDTPVTLDGSGQVQNAPYRRGYSVARQIFSTGAGPGAPAPVIPAGDVPKIIPGTLNYNLTSNNSRVESTFVPSVTYQVQEFAHYATIRPYMGTTTQTADARLMSMFPGVWTANHRLRGIAYFVAEFVYDETAFPSGIPVVTAVVKGAKVYDPRTGLTAYSENPALHARHVLTHPYFGKRAVVTAAEDARFTAAANACDAPYTPTGGTVGALYQSACVFPYGSATVDVLDDLAQACAGIWAYAGGEFYFKAGSYTAPVKALNETNLANIVSTGSGQSTSRPITITTHRARAEQINVIVPKIWNRDQDYKEIQLLPRKLDTAIAADGLELSLEVALVAVPVASRAYVIANFMLKDSRDPLTLSVTFNMSAYEVEMFDNITLTVARYGWIAKPFMVMSRSMTAEGTIEVQLKETSAALYDPLVVADVTGLASNTNLIDPWDIEPPGALTITSGTTELLVQSDGSIVTRAKVSWPLITDNRITQGGYVEVQWQQVKEGSTPVTVVCPALDSSVYLLGVPDAENITVQARTRTTLAVSDWNTLTSHYVVGKTAPPANVTGGTVALELGAVSLKWNSVTDLDLAGYEVRTVDSGWGTDTGIFFKGLALSCSAGKGLNGWYIRAFDTTNNYSVNSLYISAAFLPVSNVTSASHFFADTSLTAATVTLSWPEPDSQFPIAGYEVSYDGVTEFINASTITFPANWIDSRSFTIKTVDVYGDKASGFVYNVTKLRPSPVVDFRAQIVDNNALFYWSLPEKTSLPISHILLKRGPTWETATVLGIKDGEFTTISELAGGEYTYWMAAIDTDNYESTPVSVTAKVSQPPDFVFNAEFSSNLNNPTSVYSNAKFENGTVFLPINTTETVAQHATNTGYATPDAQIAAGFPYFIQPGLASGYYEEVFDYGTVLGSSSVTVGATVAALVGTFATAYTISTSLDNVSYTSAAGTSVFAQNFRYIKVRIAITQISAGAIAQISSLDMRLDTKLKSDTGVTACLSTDTLGTVVNFNTEFVDILDISPNVSATVARTCVYDFTDTVLSGTYSLVSNVATINVTAHNLVVGQKVRLAPTSGTMPLGVYTVASVINANSYTVNRTQANTSGNVSTYPNSARFYVFDSSGNRQSNTVSWTVRGS